MSDHLQGGERIQSARVSNGDHGAYYVVGLEVLTDDGATTYVLPPALAREIAADLVMQANFIEGAP